MASIFSRIAAGEIPSFKVAESDEFYAFLDINPVQPGHTLVIPRQEVDNIFDLDDDLLGRLHIFAKHVAKAIATAIPCRKVGVAVIGLEVPHAHIHLIPLQSEGDMDFKHTLHLPVVEMEAIAASIRDAYSKQSV